PNIAMKFLAAEHVVLMARQAIAETTPDHDLRAFFRIAGRMGQLRRYSGNTTVFDNDVEGRQRGHRPAGGRPDQCDHEADDTTPGFHPHMLSATPPEAPP